MAGFDYIAANGSSGFDGERSVLKSSSITHIFWSVSSQAVNFLVPLITLPILVKRLGISDYGIFVSNLLVWQLLTIFLDFTFTVNGTKLMDGSRERRKTISYLFVSRTYLFIVSLLILVIMQKLYLGNFAGTVLFYGFIYILGYYVTNQFWFIVNEEFKSLALVNSLSRLFFMLGIILFSRDLHTALMFQAYSMLIGGLVSLFISKYYTELVAYNGIFADSFRYILESREIFLSNLSGYLLSNMPLYIGPFILTGYLYGIYAIMDRIIRVYLSFYSGMNQVVLRNTMKLAVRSKEELHIHIRKLITYVPLIYMCVCFLGNIVAINLSTHFLHVNLGIYWISFFCLAIWSTFSVANGILGFHYLQAIGEYRKYLFIVLLSLLICILGILVFTRFVGFVGVSMGLLASEFLVFLLLLSFYRRRNKA